MSRATYGNSALHGRYLDVQVSDDAQRAGVEAEIAQGDYARLVLSAGDTSDLSLLAPYAPHIKALLIQDGVASLHGLERLTALEDFKCELVGRAPWAEFGQLRALKRCFLTWDKHFDKGAQRELFELPALQDLTLRFWSGPDCAPLACLPALQRLDLRRGAVTSTAGLEDCSTLEELSLAYLPKLTAVTPLPKLRSLHLESMPGLADGGFVAALPALTKLWLEKLRFSWPDLNWLGGLPHLEEIMNGVEVDALNWQQVFGHPHLSRFTTKAHGGYAVTDEALQDAARSRNRPVGDQALWDKEESFLRFGAGTRSLASSSHGAS
jgi:hypothetical protein